MVAAACYVAGTWGKVERGSIARHIPDTLYTTKNYDVPVTYFANEPRPFPQPPNVPGGIMSIVAE
jgi:hypothetical protein